MPIFFRNTTFLFVVRSLRYSGYLTNKSCVCQVAKILMLLIELGSISNMGCQKIKVVRSLRYSGYLTNTSCVCQVAGISKRSNDKQKSFFPKKKLACYYSRL